MGIISVSDGRLEEHLYSVQPLRVEYGIHMGLLVNFLKFSKS